MHWASISHSISSVYIVSESITCMPGQVAPSVESGLRALSWSYLGGKSLCPSSAISSSEALVNSHYVACILMLHICRFPCPRWRFRQRPTQLSSAHRRSRNRHWARRYHLRYGWRLADRAVSSRVCRVTHSRSVRSRGIVCRHDCRRRRSRGCLVGRMGASCVASTIRFHTWSRGIGESWCHRPWWCRVTALSCFLASHSQKARSSCCTRHRRSSGAVRHRSSIHWRSSSRW